MLYAAMPLEGIWQTSFFARSGNIVKHRLAIRPCDAAGEAESTLMTLAARFPGPPAWMKPHNVPAEVEKRFKQARSRQWWFRDIAGYFAFATVLSLLYVLIACSMDAQFAATTSSHNNSCMQSRPSTPHHSTVLDAPIADDFHKLNLYPSYGSAAKLQAPAAAATARQCGCSASQNLSLVHLLYRNAAAAVATVSHHSSSMGLGMLLQPKVLLHSAPLLYMWRMWFMADMVLLVKSVLCFAGLWVALSKPGLYRRPHVRTAIIAAYILLPLLMLPLRLLTCNHPHMMHAADSSAAAAAAAAPPTPVRAALAAAAAPFSSPPGPSATAFAAICSIDPEQLPTWPASYFTTCPVPTTAEAYRALLSYASFVVILDSLLHPLPLLWQALVNAASWICLASCGVLIKARYAPLAATVAAAPAGTGIGSSAGSATALVESSSSSSKAGGSADMAILLLEVLASSLDGLVLAVLLPVLISAWSTQRSRRKFMTSHNVAQEVMAESKDLLRKHTDAMLDQLHKQQQLTRPGISQAVGSAAADAAPSSSAAAATVLAPATPATSESLGGLGLELKNSSGHVPQPCMQQQQQQSSSSSSAPANRFEGYPAASQMPVVRTADEQDRGLSARRGKLATSALSNASSDGGSSTGPADASAAADTRRSSLESTASSSGNNVAAANHSKHGSGTSSSGSNNPQRQQAAARVTTSAAAVAAAGASNTNRARAPGTMMSGRFAAATADGPVGLPPGSPSGTLYNSPLETVIISFKLASSSRNGSGAASSTTPTATVAAPSVYARQAVAAAAGDTAPAGSTEVAPPVAAESPAGASAGQATASGSGRSSPGFLQQQQELAAVGTSRQLQAEIEAAVCTVVAQAQLHVLTTSVSSFPGCVHVVISVNLVALQDLQRLTAAAAAAGAASAGSQVEDGQVHVEGQGYSFGSSSSASSNAGHDSGQAAAASAAAAAAAAAARSPDSQAVPLARLVDWGQVVQQLQQQGLVTTAGDGATADVARAESAGEESMCPLQLQYMLVQDGSGQEMHWCWQRGVPAAAAAAGNTTGSPALGTAAVADAANVSDAGSATAAASFVSAVQRASFDLPTVGGELNMGTGSSSSSSSGGQSNATSSDAHALIDSGASSAHDVFGPAYTGAASSSNNSSQPALALNHALGGSETPSPRTPHQSAVLHPTAASAALGSIPPTQIHAQQALDMQAAARSKVRAEMLAAAEARAAAAVFGRPYATEVADMRGITAAAAEPFGNPTGWPAAAVPPPTAAMNRPAGVTSGPSSALNAVHSNAGSGGSGFSSSAGSTAPQHSTASTATSQATAALNRVSSILGHAHSVTLSSFSLPSDRIGWDRASLAPVLTVPDSLAASLAAQGAGLRIVITEVAAGSNGVPEYVGYGPSGLTVWPWNDHASLSQWSNLELPGSVDVWQTRVAGQASLLRTGQSGPLSAPTTVAGGAAAASAAAAVLADATFWPESRAALAAAAFASSSSSSNSSHRVWPAGGHIAIPGLLPHSVDDAWLVQHNGTVLALNILATPARHVAGADAVTSAAAFPLVSEFLLLQLPLIVVPSAVYAALTEMAARMAAEAGTYSRAYHGHLLPLVRDIAALLLERPEAQRAAAAAAAAHAGGGVAALAADMARQHVCTGVIGFLIAQGLDECAAVLQHLAGWQASPFTEAAAAEVVPVTADAGPAAAAAVRLMPAAAMAAEIEPAVALDDAILQSDDADTITEYVPYTSMVPAATGVTTAATAHVAMPPTAGAAAAAAAAGATGAIAGTEIEKSGKGEALIPQNPSPTVVKAVKQAQAAREDAQAARQTAAQAGAALANAIQALSSLSANAAAAAEHAQRAENTAAEAVRRAEAAESWARRQRALQLIGSGHVESGPLSLGVWGLMGAARSASGSTEDADNVFSGPPQLPERVTWRDVLLGFKDARLEVQYRRLKAMHVQFIDRAALLLHVVREATVVWRLGMMLMQQAGGSQLSLVLLCKYEAVTVLPYVVSLLFPDFYVHHRNFMLMLSQIACALTMGMITATEIYRQEWSQLLSPNFTPRTTPFNPEFTLEALGSAAAAAAPHAEKGLLARPAMLLVWFYLVIPLLQQLCVPEHLLGSCVPQAVQTLLAYKFIFKGEMPLLELLPWLLVGAAVSFGVAYVSDWYFRRQAVAAARRSLEVGRPVPAINGD